MNNYSRYDVMQISEYLHLCMVKAIDTALSNRVGADWFAKFKKIDSKKEKHILKEHYTSAQSMDLQSCFKFFKHGSDYAKIVFEFYGNNFYLQNQDAQQAEKQLQFLLNNLMNNVRNEVCAHASANMIENGESSVRYSVYGYNEAVNDMIKFASFFKQVLDSDGVSYYQKMLSMTQVKNSYSIADTIRCENLKADIGTFVTACNKLNIGITTGANGELLFISSNYSGDLAQITLLLNRNQSKKSKTALIVIIAVIIAIVGAVALIVGLSGKDDTNNAQPDYNHTNVQSTTATSASGTDAQTQNETQPATTPQSNGTHMYGEASYEGLTFKVDQEQDDKIILYYENNSTVTYSFGWGGQSSNFIIETESGKYKSDQYASRINNYVNPGDSGKISLEYGDIDERIVSLTCDNIYEAYKPFIGTVTIPIEYK